MRNSSFEQLARNLLLVFHHNVHHVPGLISQQGYTKHVVASGRHAQAGHSFATLVTTVENF
jgi:hypothetical protein